MLAVGQGYIGDIGQQYGLAEGGAAKIAMHSALGGTYALDSGGNVAVGILAGGMSEALSGFASNLAVGTINNGGNISSHVY